MLSFGKMGGLARGRRGGLATVLAVTLLSSGAMVALQASPAAATTQADFSYDNGPACSGGTGWATGAIHTNASLRYSGNLNPAIKLLSKTNYDVGAAEAIAAYPAVFGRPATCAEIAAETTKSATVALKDVMCRGGGVYVNDFCNPGSDTILANPPVNCSGSPAYGTDPAGLNYEWRAIGAKLAKVKIPFLGFFGVSAHPVFQAIVVRLGTPDSEIDRNGKETGTRILLPSVAQKWADTLRGVQTIYRVKYHDPNLSVASAFYGWVTEHVSDYVNFYNSLCMKNPGAMFMMDYFGSSLGGDGVNHAIRGLFDKLANVPVGTDVLCSSIGYCGSVYTALQKIAASPTSKADIKVLIQTFLAG